MKTTPKNKPKTKKTKNPSTLNINVRAAPVSSHPRVRSGKVRQQTLKNGHMVISASTCVPISSASNATTFTTSNDLSVGNSTLFPTLANSAKGFDKVKWKRLQLRWVSSLPTTAGGSVGMYYDTDRSDIGATTMQLLAQNKNSVSGANWDRLTLNVPKAMLRSNEWFTTYDAQTASVTENTFTSPGRFHLLNTSQPGVTYSTATTIGYLWVTYEAELGFPSATTDTNVPTRRAADKRRATHTVRYEAQTVSHYENFMAGCLRTVDFYTFLSFFSEDGILQSRFAKLLEPDEISWRLEAPRVGPQYDLVQPFKILGSDRERIPVVWTATSEFPESEDEPDWSSTGSDISNDQNEQ